MPYTVFALKWRPKNFDEIVGQPHIVAKLKGAIEKGRIANAYLFSGPRGVGKTSTARILAKALNCKEGPTVNPCGKCGSCIDITQGRSLDVIEVDGASNRGIDEIRALRENVKFSPTQGRSKVYIIDEVHMLTTEAFNALLKTLEEPPEFVKFILATTHPHKVIPTVRSRCQPCDFRRITTMEIVSQLKKIALLEKIKAADDVLFTVAKASDGSLRDAESILDQLVSFVKDDLSLQDAVSLLGIVEQETLFKITDEIVRHDPRAVLALLDKLINDGKDAGVFLSNLVDHFRNLMVAKIAKGEQGLIDLPQEICQRLLKQSENFSLGEIFSIFKILGETHEMARRLDSLRIPLEINLARIAHLKGEQPIRPAAEKKAPEPLSKPPQERRPPSAPEKEEIENKNAPARSVKAAPQPEEGLSSKNQAINISLDEIKSAWQGIVEGVSRVKMYVATCLSKGAPLKLEKDALTIGLPDGYHKESLDTKDNRIMIEKAISENFNANLRVNFILARELLQESKEAHDESLIKDVLDTFDGRVIRRE